MMPPHTKEDDPNQATPRPTKMTATAILASHNPNNAETSNNRNQEQQPGLINMTGIKRQQAVHGTRHLRARIQNSRTVAASPVNM
jgi:hypothetical protein